VTQNNGITKTGKSRRSAIDERTTRRQRYGMPQSRRAMIECIFGRGKQYGTMRKTKHRVICRVAADFMLNLIAYNLIPVPSSSRPAQQNYPEQSTASPEPRPQEKNQCCSPRISISRRRL
jgi:hypothetical protein